jgi:diacylglycerol kinase family enzyme
VVPAGTGNLLAGNLALPTEPADAAAAIAAGARRRIDVGRVNGEGFIVMAGTGFDALMIRDASSALKRRIGSTAYVLSALRHLRESLEPTTVEIDGEVRFRGRTTMVLVGNFGTVTGGLAVFPDARPDDGRLDVAVLRVSGLREWASVAWRMVRSRQQRHDLVARFTASEVIVRNGRPRPYEIDGEARRPARELRFEVRPASLDVLGGQLPDDDSRPAGTDDPS